MQAESPNAAKLRRSRSFVVMLAAALLASFIALVGSAQPAFAVDVDGQAHTCGDYVYRFYYAFDSNAGKWVYEPHLEITQYTGSDSVVDIPESLDGYPVTHINNGKMFSKNTTLIEVAIPDSVVFIGESAFAYCINLERVTFGDSVDTIYIGCFSGCTKLGEVSLPDSLKEVGNLAFAGCTNMTLASADLPTSLATIGNDAFCNCESITAVHIPDSVTSLGAEAFDGCTSLHDVTMGSGNASLPESAFSGCSALESIAIPDQVTSIGKSAFAHTGLQDVAIPDHVTTIGANAFTYCKSLGAVSLGESVETIGKEAFGYCSALGRIELPASLTSLGEGAFEYCSALERIELPVSITSLGDRTFRYCSAIEEAVVNGSAEIPYEAFNGCSNLKSVTIAETVPAVGDSAFYGCPLVKLDTGAGVKSIGAWAFHFFEGPLKALVIGDAVTSIGERAFSGDSLETVVFGSSVTSLGSYAFLGDSAGDTSVYFRGSAPTAIDTQPLKGLKGTAYIPEGDASWTQDVKDALGGDFEWKTWNPATDDIDPLNLVLGTPFSGETDLWFRASLMGGDSRVSDCVWTDSWFLKKDAAATYNHDLASTSVVLACAAYDEELVAEDLKALGFEEVVSYFPDEDDYPADFGQVAYTFAVKEVKDVSSGGIVPVIAVIVRGTPSNGEWLSNFNVSDSSPDDISGVHEGFAACRDQVLTALGFYLRRDVFEEKNFDSARVLLTGHSRGAAVANLTAASLIDGASVGGWSFDAGDVYAYTFAAPAVARHATDQTRYAGIFNIVNPEDIVPKMPLGGWGYYRYGKTLVLPSRSNMFFMDYARYLSAVKADFDDYTDGLRYHPYASGSLVPRMIALELQMGIPTVKAYYSSTLTLVSGHPTLIFGSPHDDVVDMLDGFMLGGSKTRSIAALDRLTKRMPLATPCILATVLGKAGDDLVRLDYDVFASVTEAHVQETYVAWMRNVDASVFEGRSYTGARIACPVDVRVYDQDGTLVCEIVDDEVNEGLDYGGLAAYVDGDVKYIDIPQGANYRIETTATDQGEMDVALTRYDDEGKALEQAGYDALELVGNEAYNLQLDTHEGTDVALAGTATLTDGAGATIEEDYDVSAEQMGSIELAAEAVGPGGVACPTTATRGDRVTARALPADNAFFTGWYLDGALVSNELAYTFRVDGPTQLEPRFEEITVEVEDQTYDYGTDLEPPATVKAGETLLVQDRDYELTYSDNYEAGQATITVTGIGAYRGKLNRSFTIRPASNFIEMPTSTVTRTGNVSKTQSFTRMATSPGMVSYRSSSKYVTVDSSGTVTIAKNFAGTAMITATSDTDPNFEKANPKSYLVKVIPGKMTVSKATNIKGKKAKITWKKMTGADQYKVRISLKKTMRKAKAYSAASSRASLTISKLKKGKTYYVQIRAYDNQTKSWGAWSAAKKVKIRK